MFAVSGATGQVGGAVAEALLDAGLPVRAIVRSAAKGRWWQALGCEIALVPDVTDVAAQVRAFSGAQAVFVINPPNYDPEPDFPDTHAAASASAQALDAVRPQRTVLLSSIGAQVQRFNLLNNAGIFEATFGELDLPVTMLRPAWFMENAAADLDMARGGSIDSCLQPLDHAIDMVSVLDIGRTAAELLQDLTTACRVVELAGPGRYSANDVATGFAKAFDRPVTTKAIPRSNWESLFRSQGMQHPAARIAMLDGFNADWIGFECGAIEHRVGTTSLDDVLLAIANRAVRSG